MFRAAANWPGGACSLGSKQFQIDGLVSAREPSAAQTAQRQAGKPHAQLSNYTLINGMSCSTHHFLPSTLSATELIKTSLF